MRRILMFMGIAILAFPMVAVGAVKVRTKTGGHKWDFPAGKARVKGFKAPVKAGPFTLGFHSQIELDFNSNHQFDFSDDVADGQANNGVAGINPAVGLAVPRDDQKGDEFINEIRFGMDAVAGPFTTRILLEKVGNIVAETGTEASGLQVERAWGDVDLGWFNVRYGIELYAIEPTYMLYGDDDYMLSIYKNTGDFAWRISYMKRNDGDPDAGQPTATVSTLVPGSNVAGTSVAGEGTNNDTDIVMVFIEIPFANPLGPGTMSVQPFYVLDHDKRFKVPELTLADGSEFDGTIVSHYLGATIITNLGPVKAVISGAYNFGTDNTGFNAVNSANGLPRDDVDISAWQAYALLALPIAGIPLTVEAGAYLASGDDDPFDDTASGWLGVTHNSEMFGGNDIFISKTEDGSQMTVRLDRGPGIGLNESVTLSNDDEAILQGLSSFNNVACAVVGPGCSAAAVAAGFHPARGVFPTPGSNTSGGDPYAVNNRSHPGIAIAHVALNYKLLKNATVRGSYEHIRLMQTEGFSSDATTFTAGPGILATAGDIDGHFGDQIGISAKWSPAKYVTFEPGFTVLFPGDAVEDLTGSDDTAWQIRLGMRWAF